MNQLSMIQSKVVLMKTKFTIKLEELQESSDLLRALAHPLRMRILRFIDEHGTVNVNKIYNTMKLEQSITSQHLRIMRDVGVVITEREGKFVHYGIDYERLGTSILAVREFVNVPKES